MYRVLLADDEQIERMALARRLMRRFGDSLQISEATDGKEAVELYQKEHSQIIIMDISMPELNGVEAAEQIRSMDEDCVIVFLTAYDEFSYAKRAIVIRALDYLLKPCDEEELTAVMEEAMRLTDKAVHNKENPTGNRAEMTEAEKEAEKRREQWPWNPDAEAPKDPETERMNQVAEKIRSMDEDCIIVFLTAYDEFSYAKRAIVIRALDYLLKPCDEEELTAVMEEAMRLTDKAVENKKNSSGSGEEKTEAEKEAEKRKEQWPWNPDAEPPKDPETERVNQVAEKIRTYIRENYMNEISMQDAARQFNYSDAYFCKLFKQCFDQNFTTYLTNFRINEAKRLLKDRNISVKDAGMKVGYYDSNYFAKVFKRVTGMIPSEYREAN